MTAIPDSVVLHRAKGHLKRRERFICHAIQATRVPQKQKDSLCDWVRNMLQGHVTYESWIHQHHREVYWKMEGLDTHNARLQWLDWMIAYCEKEEAKGDKKCESSA